MFEGIRDWNGYAVWENDGGYINKHESTAWHRYEGTNIQVAANVDYRNGRLNRVHLRVQPDGYWSDVITATLGYDPREEYEVSIRIAHSSGGETDEDKTYPNGNVNVGVKCDIQRCKNFIEGLQFAALFTAMYKIAFREQFLTADKSGSKS